MTKFHSSICEDLANEQPPVAVMRIALAAEQGNAMTLRAPSMRRSTASSNVSLFGHRPIQRMALRVVVLLA